LYFQSFMLVILFSTRIINKKYYNQSSDISLRNNTRYVIPLHKIPENYSTLPKRITSSSVTLTDITENFFTINKLNKIRCPLKH